METQRMYDNTCDYCYEKWTSEKQSRYCSLACKKLDEQDYQDYRDLVEMGYYTNMEGE
jgi:hypothetical protein